MSCENRSDERKLRAAQRTRRARTAGVCAKTTARCLPPAAYFCWWKVQHFRLLSSRGSLHMTYCQCVYVLIEIFTPAHPAPPPLSQLHQYAAHLAVLSFDHFFFFKGRGREGAGVKFNKRVCVCFFSREIEIVSTVIWTVLFRFASVDGSVTLSALTCACAVCEQVDTLQI